MIKIYKLDLSTDLTNVFQPYNYILSFEGHFCYTDNISNYEEEPRISGEFDVRSNLNYKLWKTFDCDIGNLKFLIPEEFI